MLQTRECSQRPRGGLENRCIFKSQFLHFLDVSQEGNLHWTVGAGNELALLAAHLWFSRYHQPSSTSKRQWSTFLSSFLKACLISLQTQIHSLLPGLRMVSRNNYTSPPLVWFSISSVTSLFFCLLHFAKIPIFFFLFWLHPWHMEVPGPGIKSEPQRQPTPQLQ